MAHCNQVVELTGQRGHFFMIFVNENKGRLLVRGAASAKAFNALAVVSNFGIQGRWLS